MKKALWILLALTVLLMAGCGKEPAVETTEPIDTEPAVETTQATEPQPT